MTDGKTLSQRINEMRSTTLSREKHLLFVVRKRSWTTASLKTCLCRQVFVRVETSRSHLARSAVDMNLIFFWFSKQIKLVPILSQVRVNLAE